MGNPQTNSEARLVVGLRNPGADYEGSRHNVGAEVVALVATRLGESFARGPRQVRGQVSTSGVGADRTILLLPNTFMNESGGPVAAAIRYFKLQLEDVLVVHDDIDLDFGRLKVQEGRGSGGHNGVRSVENTIGSNEFWRLKIGVGRPPGSQDPADYVLRRFAKAERPEVGVIVQDAADVVISWLAEPARSQELAAHRGKNG